MESKSQKALNSLKNLIPKPKDLSKRPDHIELSRKGGNANTPKQKKARLLNALKNPNTKDSTKKKWLLELCGNPETSAYHILELVKSINWDEASTKEKTMIAKTLIDWHKIRHPITQKIEHTGTLNIKNALQLLEQDDTEPTRN